MGVSPDGFDFARRAPLARREAIALVDVHPAASTAVRLASPNAARDAHNVVAVRPFVEAFR
jgi:hypothetical protein